MSTNGDVSSRWRRYETVCRLIQTEMGGQSCNQFADTISAEWNAIAPVNKAFLPKVFFVLGLSNSVRTRLMETAREEDNLADLSRWATELTSQDDVSQ